MATKTARRGLGRGLAALIPESDFDLLNTVARGEIAPLPIAESPDGAAPAPAAVEVAPNVAKTESSAEAAPAISTNDIRYLAIESVEPNPFQPPQVFSEEELEKLSQLGS